MSADEFTTAHIEHAKSLQEMANTIRQAESLNMIAWTLACALDARIAVAGVGVQRDVAEDVRTVVKIIDAAVERFDAGRELSDNINPDTLQRATEADKALEALLRPIIDARVIVRDATVFP